MAVRDDKAPGTYIAGKFVGSGLGKRWGEPPRQPYVVTLLLGRSTRNIEYPTEADALAAVGGKWPAEGSLVELRAFAQISGSREARDKTWLTWVGPRAAGGSDGDE